MPTHNADSHDGPRLTPGFDTAPPSPESRFDESDADISLVPGRSTPTAKLLATENDNTPTPIQPRFHPGETGETDETSEEAPGEEDEDNLDDDEFESHYSRQDSPVSSEEDEEQGDDQQAGVISEADEAIDLSMGKGIERVNSMPVSFGNSHAHITTSQSTTSLPRTAPPLPPPLYPPFYGRPPSPLPPSPSLTSLLRPPSILNRSTTSTRPTTPDSSDVETPNDTEAAVAHSARRANPLPPTAPKVPTYEYYGFVLYLASTLAFLIYILWSYLPSALLHALGITYYPNRWWSLAIPAWIVMVLVYTYVALACWNVEYMTLALQRLETMVDEAGSVAILDDHGRLVKGGSKRYETEVAERQRRTKISTTLNKRKAASSRKKDRRKMDREGRDEERFGYIGPVTTDGRVANGMTWTQVWNEGTDAVMDVPIGGVCEVLYGDHAEEV